MRTFSLSRAALFTSRTGKWHSEETSGRGEEKRKEEELQCGHCKKEWRISMASSKDRVCDNEQMVSCKGCWSLRLKQVCFLQVPVPNAVEITISARLPQFYESQRRTLINWPALTEVQRIFSIKDELCSQIYS